MIGIRCRDFEDNCWNKHIESGLDYTIHSSLPAAVSSLPAAVVRGAYSPSGQHIPPPPPHLVAGRGHLSAARGPHSPLQQQHETQKNQRRFKKSITTETGRNNITYRTYRTTYRKQISGPEKPLKINLTTPLCFS